MKRFVFHLAISISAFCSGVFFVPVSYPQFSLEEITQNSEFYDGRRVEVITYAQISRFGEDSLISVGEPFEKKEAATYLDFGGNSAEHLYLQRRLSESYSVNKYKRVKVRVIGKVYDNCNKGIPCCFGKSMKIITESIEPIGQIEDYTVPLEFQLDDSRSNSE